MRGYSCLFAAAVTMLLAAPVAPAQQVEFNLLTVEGLVTGAKFSVDEEYSEKYGRPVPSPFDMIVPLGDDYINAVEEITNQGPFVKIHFAKPDRTPMENIQLVPMTLPMPPADRDPGDRLKLLAKLLSEQAYPQSTAGQMGSKIEVLRAIELGQHQGVELIARYADPNYGPTFLRMVGLPHPARAESVYAVINVISQQVPIQGLDDFQKTQTGRALSTLRYR